MQRTSEFAQVTTPAGPSTIVGVAAALAMAPREGFTGEANAKALYVGDLSALAAAALTRRRG